MKALHLIHLPRVLLVCAIGVAFAAPAPAQPIEQEPRSTAAAQAPAHISFVDGVAILERDGENDESPDNMPLLAGDRVRTRTGRVEILFADGSTLHLDQHSAIDLQSDELVRLIEGRIRISIPGPTREIAYRVDGPFGWAQILEPGEYRIALLNGPSGRELEVAVLRGSAELANEDGRTALRAGERAFARAATAPSYAYIVNSAAWDAFDRWSETLRDERRGASARYLPDEVRPYAASLERHGYWRDEPTYGRVWYPRVASDWRPYYRGRWVLLRPYGWTWVAHDPWGWPTHHYGRWGYSTAGWFWIPGRTWGPAWVSWAYAPGYVSWCPLGWNNRPVFQINVNIGRGYDSWHAWTVIPRRHFGVGFVHRSVVRSVQLDHRTRGAFVHGARAPEVVGHAVPRASSPIRVAGARDGRRPGTPLYTNLPPDRARLTSDGPRVRMAEPPRREARPRAEAPGMRSMERAQPPAQAARPDVRGARPSVERARPSVEGARPSVEILRPSVERARPSRDNAPSRAVPRDRTMPDRPAVRSERLNSGAGVTRQAPPRAVPPRAQPPRADSAPSAAPPRATPRAVARDPQQPPAARPMTRPSSEAPRYQPPTERQPRAQPPQVRPPNQSAPGRAAPRAERPAPSGERGRPSGVSRPGPDRPAAGSTGRGSPGARPRPGGGER